MNNTRTLKFPARKHYLYEDKTPKAMEYITKTINGVYDNAFTRSRDIDQSTLCVVSYGGFNPGNAPNGIITLDGSSHSVESFYVESTAIFGIKLSFTLT